MKFTSLSLRSTGHSRQLIIHPKIILNSNGGIGLCFLFDLYPLLGFNRLVQSITPATTRHQTTRILIHDHDFATLHHIFFVFFVKGKGAQQLRNRMNAFAFYLKFQFRLFALLALFLIT